MDGRLDDAVYGRHLPATGFLQQEPQEGAGATEETEVWVLFDRNTLYIAGRCRDSEPARMIQTELRRDSSGLFNNENFAVALDTFNDGRNGYLFHTNPLGGMYDSQFTDERNENVDWNGVWTVRTARIPDGWTVEVAIPFKSLRYGSNDERGQQTWGINFRQIVRWKNEFSYLTRIPASYGGGGVFKVSSAASLVDLEAPGRAADLDVKPYVLSGVVPEVSGADVTHHGTGDAGVDVKKAIGRNLNLDSMYNTDFAQVEADNQQINFSRFSLFYPEKREFFLESQGIFEEELRPIGRVGLFW